jgi:GDP-4-dehydro-6-deoxy-D-mannose reductase
MKKFLITGVSGFVGQHFLDYLEKNQIRAQVLGIDRTSAPESRSPSCVDLEIKQVDLLHSHEIERLLFEFQPDYILHLAAYSSVAFSWKEPVLSFQNNMNVFLNLVETIRKLDLKSRVLSVGSSEIYGNVNEENLPLVEEGGLDPVSPYAVARASQEMLTNVYSNSYGVDLVTTRSFNHIGPGQKDVFVVPSFAKQVAEIKKSGRKKGVLTTGDLSIVRDFLDVRDVVRAYYLILTKGKKGRVYNVCSGTGHALQDVVDLLAESAGVEITTEVNPAYIRPSDNRKIIGSNQRICDELGWSPSFSLRQSLQDVFEYWNDQV